MQEEQSYLDLLQRILETGELREGRNGRTKGLFGERLVFHLEGGKTFPLLTTKRVFVRGVVEELLWFLRGSTNVQELQAKNVHIWDGNSSRTFLDSVGLAHVPEGDIGVGYGCQWRSFGCDPHTRQGGVDQLHYVLQELRTNPHGRRCVLSAWNPPHLSHMALPPCHVLYQFYLGEQGLCCQMLQRSVDTAAGLPFNIASVACFTQILAHVLRVPAHKIILVLGDTHLYEPHWANAHLQKERVPRTFPSLRIQKKPPCMAAPLEEILLWIESLVWEDFVLEGYDPHPALAFPMVA